MNLFGQRLKELRATKNLTQKDMATLLNIKERQFQGYELGTTAPRFQALIFIADYFNVSIDYLVGRTDNPEVNK